MLREMNTDLSAIQISLETKNQSRCYPDVAEPRSVHRQLWRAVGHGKKWRTNPQYPIETDFFNFATSCSLWSIYYPGLGAGSKGKEKAKGFPAWDNHRNRITDPPGNTLPQEPLQSLRVKPRGGQGAPHLSVNLSHWEPCLRPLGRCLPSSSANLWAQSLSHPHSDWWSLVPLPVLVISTNWNL